MKYYAVQVDILRKKMKAKIAKRKAEDSIRDEGLRRLSDEEAVSTGSVCPTTDGDWEEISNRGGSR